MRCPSVTACLENDLSNKTLQAGSTGSAQQQKNVIFCRDLKCQEITPFKATQETCKCIENQSKLGVKDIKEAKPTNKENRTLGTIRN